MTMIHESRRSRLWLRPIAIAAGLALLTSGCFLKVANDHMAKSPDTRPWYCNAVGDGTPWGGHGNGSHVPPIYDGMEKGPLGWDDCLELSDQFDQVHGAISDKMTRAEGEAAEWREVAQYIPGLGTHHTKDFFQGSDGGDGGDGGTDGDGSGDDPPMFEFPPFDPAEPQFLIYGGRETDAPLVGVAYAAPGSSDPPEAFAGTNDWWHLHQKICFDPETRNILAGAEEIPDEECETLGGTQFSLGPGIWLLHLWIVPKYQLQFDVFSAGHPCLGEDEPLPWEDECWGLVRWDPADGPVPVPTTDHDRHDDHSH